MTAKPVPEHISDELLPCPFCGGMARLHDYPSYSPYVDCSECDCALDHAKMLTVEQAIAAWNRRSSDEQAEVVGWRGKYRTEEKWKYFDHPFDGFDPDKYQLEPLYASPPAVAAGGVTEARAIVAEMVARNERNGFLTDWWCKKLDALTASLAVGDEGIREGRDHG